MPVQTETMVSDENIQCDIFYQIKPNLHTSINQLSEKMSQKKPTWYVELIPMQLQFQFSSLWCKINQ